MKYLFLLFFIFAGLFSMAEARENIWTDYRIPMPNAYVSQGVYYSSNTNAIIGSTSTAIISTYPAIVEIVIIASGTPNSKLDIYDTATSTDAAGVRKVFGWSMKNDTISQPGQFNVYCASGVGINNIGPVDAYIYWREK